MLMKTLSVLPCGYWDAGEGMGLVLASKQQQFEHETPSVASLVVGLRVRYANSFKGSK